MTASENGPPWYIGHANDVSLAVAARDAAIERADQQMAARFAGEARDAIATAVKAGVTLDELAEEIGYPDGAEAMDGPHIDRQIADMHDNGPAFALGSLPESQEGSGGEPSSASTNEAALRCRCCSGTSPNRFPTSSCAASRLRPRRPDRRRHVSPPALVAGCGEPPGPRGRYEREARSRRLHVADRGER